MADILIQILMFHIQEEWIPTAVYILNNGCAGEEGLLRPPSCIPACWGICHATHLTVATSLKQACFLRNMGHTARPRRANFTAGCARKYKTKESLRCRPLASRPPPPPPPPTLGLALSSTMDAHTPLFGGDFLPVAPAYHVAEQHPSTVPTMFEGAPADAFPLDGYPAPGTTKMMDDMTRFDLAAALVCPHTHTYDTFEGTFPADITGEFPDRVWIIMSPVRGRMRIC